MRRTILFLSLAAAACGQPVPKGNAGADANTALPDIVTPEAASVAIGELGPNVDACPAAGATTHLEAGGRLPVRSAPFDNAGETGAIPPAGRFFVCTRSLDQKWFGIVYDEGGTLAERCGVSEPVTQRRNYAGPCRSGWVASAFVKLIAGEAPSPPDSNGAARAPQR
jgi:hypothetical protein